MRNIRSGNLDLAAPEENGKGDHEGSVGAKVCGKGKVRVKGGRAILFLHGRQVRSLPPNDRNQIVPESKAPSRQSQSVY